MDSWLRPTQLSYSKGGQSVDCGRFPSRRRLFSLSTAVVYVADRCRIIVARLFSDTT